MTDTHYTPPRFYVAFDHGDTLAEADGVNWRVEDDAHDGAVVAICADRENAVEAAADFNANPELVDGIERSEH